MRERTTWIWWLPALWWVGVLGLGYDTDDRAREAARWKAGEREALQTARLFLSKDSDEHLYFAYASFIVGDPRADRAYVADNNQRPIEAIPEPDGQPKWPYVDLPVEYPPLGVAFVTLPRLVAPTLDLYRHALALLVTATLMGALCVGLALRRRLLGEEAARMHERSIAWWALGSAAALGLVTVTRFDALPAALAFFGIAAAVMGRTTAGGALLGLGTAAKVWPAFLVPLLIAWLLGRRRMRDAIQAAIAAGVAFVLPHLPFLLVSPAGVLAAYAYHGERGLQIESLAASILMLARLLGLIDARVDLTHGAFELITPAAAPIAAVLRFALPAVSLGVAIVVYVASRHASREPADPRAPGHVLLLASLGLVASLLVSNFILSPQYLVWLLPFVLVAEARPTRFAALFVAIAAATQLLYPLLYPMLRAQHPALVGVLLLRNGLLCAVAFLALRAALRVARSTRADEARRPVTQC